METLVGVVVGGFLTLTGTAVAEWWRSRIASLERQERRAAAAREYNRRTLDQLQNAAADYRRALVAYQRELAVSRILEEGLEDTRLTYQTLLHRVVPEVTRALSNWERTAVTWAQGEGAAVTENARWDEAMRRCGEAVRRNL